MTLDLGLGLKGFVFSASRLQDEMFAVSACIRGCKAQAVQGSASLKDEEGCFVISIQKGHKELSFQCQCLLTRSSLRSTAFKGRSRLDIWA